ncbi:MAG: hypothetical protein H6742_09415 [Alphaproteobacteria bacterium]|nr:hypothetical protein [Alphaproteobacteria bacterium]
MTPSSLTAVESVEELFAPDPVGELDGDRPQVLDLDGALPLLDLSVDELEGALRHAEDSNDEDTCHELADAAELLAVTHRIAGNMIEVVALAGAQVLSPDGAMAGLARLEPALDALERLARASGELAHLELIQELSLAVDLYRERQARGTGRATFRDALRAWLPRYAAHVGGPDGDRLRQLVEVDIDAVPLFASLQALDGVGPRRLARLHAAGFYEPETVRTADPVELAQVAGLPRDVARRVVEHAQVFEERRQRRCVLEMQRRIEEFRRVVASLDGGPSELRTAAQAALSEMQATLAAFG